MSGTNPRESLRANMRRLRALKGFSQAKLAERMDISASHVAEIEVGNRFPSAEVLFTMAEVLGVTPSVLLMDPEEAQAFEDFKQKRVLYQEVGMEILAEVKNLLKTGK